MRTAKRTQVAVKMPEDGTRQRGPADDPQACSRCGVYIGSFSDGEYCDGCARELGLKDPLRRCEECGQRALGEHMEAIDVTPPDEYYPKFVYLCPSCQDGDSGAR